eukprot:360892_1
MRTLVFILLLFISNAQTENERTNRCPSTQCCLPPTPDEPTLQCTLSPTHSPAQSPTPSPTSRGECLEDIYDDCLHIYFIFFCSGASIGLISGIVSHKYCNCGKYCSKENSNANDQNDIGMQKYDE